MGYIDGYDINDMKIIDPKTRQEAAEWQEWDSDSDEESHGSFEADWQSDEEAVEYGGWQSGSSSADSSDSSDSSDSDQPGRQKRKRSKFEEKCVEFTGLNYTGNSCYQDSVLLALFALPNHVITEHILEKNVKTISKSPMRGLNNVKYCSTLRNLIRKCPGSQEFEGTGTQDAGEFLLYIFSLFQVNVMTKERFTRVTNDLSDFPEQSNVIELLPVQEDASPAVTVPGISIANVRSVRLTNFLAVMDDARFDSENLYRASDGKRYRRKIEVSRIISTPYLVFNVQRLYWNNHGIKKRANTKIEPPQIIEMAPEQLELTAIIVHVPAHYTCYIKCMGKWFYYDDSPSKSSHTIIPIGSYAKMLKSNPSPLTKGTLYFYAQ
jgi:hypothetical protein